MADSFPIAGPSAPFQSCIDVPNRGKRWHVNDAHLKHANDAHLKQVNDAQLKQANDGHLKQAR